MCEYFHLWIVLLSKTTKVIATAVNSIAKRTFENLQYDSMIQIFKMSDHFFYFRETVVISASLWLDL